MKHNLFILFIIIILTFSGCKKDDVQVQEFKIIAESVYNRATKIVLTVDCSNASVLKLVEGYISESSDMSNAINVNGDINNKGFVLTFNSLKASTTWYIFYKCSNGIDDLAKSDIKIITTNEYGLPVVTTNDLSVITATYVFSGGDVIDDGDLEVTAKGVCWSTRPNPTIDDNHTNNGTGLGSFTSQLTNLSPDTTYYYRAFASNSLGTNYGELKSFIATDHPGAIDGLYSVSSSKKVRFSPGNLQYRASTNTWRFADNQYDYIGNNNSHVSAYYDDWIDLFGWGTSGYNHGAVCYQQYSTSKTNSDYFVYGYDRYSLNSQTGQADWGYNAISNGGNAENKWHTLTNVEWQYVFHERITSSGIRYAKAQVNGTNGVILLPDDWRYSNYILHNVNTIDASFHNNTISLNEWNTKLEANGAVFLPAAGYRYGNSVNVVGLHGWYWSASSNWQHYANGAYYIQFYDEFLSVCTEEYTIARCHGCSVRLVYYID